VLWARSPGGVMGAGSVCFVDRQSRADVSGYGKHSSGRAIQATVFRGWPRRPEPKYTHDIGHDRVVAGPEGPGGPLRPGGTG